MVLFIGSSQFSIGSKRPWEECAVNTVDKTGKFGDLNKITAALLLLTSMFHQFPHKWFKGCFSSDFTAIYIVTRRPYFKFMGEKPGRVFRRRAKRITALARRLSMACSREGSNSRLVGAPP
ncbi:hypothetical protein [Brenneria corticis]|uniref:hypothetical protein n=1 Tax=Brenneria corticis TaxID=2173106 RepID=UPI00109DF0AD|nr:hypothetical protein [Brenneria sp. CFCC 11842]